MESDRERDERVMAIVSAALLLPPEERAAHIRDACGTDGSLYREVAETLEWEQRMGNFLRQPAIVLDESGHPFQTGEIISERFEIVREIGEGAMGIVYEAFDLKRRQRIAIKAAKSGFRRFLSPELESALKVRHRNVCLVNEIHSAQTKYGEVDFLTMELLEGETLSARLSASGKFPASEAMEIGRQLCSGLAEAHRIAVIHRDLKSGNVILCRAENQRLRAVITDFGLSGETNQPEVICGTPRYIAPELWLGEKASAASDIYALGVILFEIAAGRIASGDLSDNLGTHASGTSKRYSRLVEGCLSLEPRKRCQAFEEALHPHYWDAPIWTRRKAVAVAGSVVCAAAGAAWVERSGIVDLIHPLPSKRFVALLPWPAAADTNIQPVLSGAIDAIENELSRAESSDRNFFVISSEELATPGSVARICESLGANLALEASGNREAARFQLHLKLLEATSNALLRQTTVVCSMERIASLSAQAVQAAAKLLDVHLPKERRDVLKPGTNSASAFRALQTAEESMKRPNDEALEKAIEDYKAAIDADPFYSSAYAKLAVAYSRLYAVNRDPGTLELVEANGEKAIRLDPNMTDAYLALSAVYQERGDQEKALYQIRRALALDPTNCRTLLWLGQIYWRFNRWTEAQQTYIRLRKERPNYWPAYNELGYILTEQGKYQDAIQAFQAAAAIAPGSAMAFTNLGDAFLKLGQVAAAKDNFEKSLKLKPSDVAYSNLADALRAQGNYAEALPFSQRAVALKPSDDQNWLDLGDCYDSLRGRQKEARDAYRRAAEEAEKRLKTDPADTSSWIRLSLYRAKTGSPGEATSFLSKAGHFGGTDLDSELIKARAYEVLGKRKDALATLADCLKRGTTPFEVACVRDFAGLRKDPEYAKMVRVTTTKN